MSVLGREGMMWRDQWHSSQWTASSSRCSQTISVMPSSRRLLRQTAMDCVNLPSYYFKKLERHLSLSWHFLNFHNPSKVADTALICSFFPRLQMDLIDHLEEANAMPGWFPALSIPNVLSPRPFAVAFLTVKLAGVMAESELWWFRNSIYQLTWGKSFLEKLVNSNHLRKKQCQLTWYSFVCFLVISLCSRTPISELELKGRAVIRRLLDKPGIRAKEIELS